MQFVCFSRAFGEGRPLLLRRACEALLAFRLCFPGQSEPSQRTLSLIMPTEACIKKPRMAAGPTRGFQSRLPHPCISRSPGALRTGRAKMGSLDNRTPREEIRQAGLSVHESQGGGGAKVSRGTGIIAAARASDIPFFHQRLSPWSRPSAQREGRAWLQQPFTTTPNADQRSAFFGFRALSIRSALTSSLSPADSVRSGDFVSLSRDAATCLQARS